MASERIIAKCLLQARKRDVPQMERCPPPSTILGHFIEFECYIMD